MAISSANAAAAPATRRIETLTSGTSWTVPTGVTYVNAKLIGAGGGGGGAYAGNYTSGAFGQGGTIIETTVSTTPGASITYAIGAGGSGGTGGGSAGSGTSGGSTTFTGATTASGGSGGVSNLGGSTAGQSGYSANNGGQGGNTGAGGAGGAGVIYLEYFL
jgi:hypothetical protein